MTPDREKPIPGPRAVRTNPFRRKRSFKPLAPQEAERQGAISTLAFQLLGGRDPALNFLNTDNRPLGGRPITIATQSKAGYAAVERAIHSLSVLPGNQHGV